MESGETMELDRRQFMATSAATFGTEFANLRAATAQTGTRPLVTPPALPPDAGLFERFEARWVRTRGADIFLRHGGDGPPLLLLHGNPLTHASWHQITGPLRKRFHTV